MVADALSRPGGQDPLLCAAVVPSPTPVGFSYGAVAEAQACCMETAALRTTSALRVTSVPSKNPKFPLWGDISTSVFRPLLPPKFRRLAFEGLHNIGHPGVRASRRLMSARFVWAGLSKDVTAWARECLPCQRAKVHRHITLPPAVIGVPSRRFSHVHVDLVLSLIHI